MEELVTVIEFDWRVVIVVTICLLATIVAVWKKIDYIKEKLGIKTRRDEERDLLITTAENLSKLQERHANDMKHFQKTQAENMEKANRHDEMIKEELRAFTQEIRLAIETTQREVNDYSDKRIHDREQSLKIQKELNL